jgi:hypothetical protein
MPKKSLGDLQFAFDDETTDLMLTGYDEGDEFEEEDEYEEEVSDDEEEVVDDEEEEVDDDTVTLASRVNGIEKTLQALPNMISSAIATALKGNKQDEEEEEIPEELDNKQIVNILGKRMEKAVDKRVNAIMEQNEPALRQARYTAQFQAAAAKHGQKFVDRMVPIARAIQRSNYTRDVEDVYEDFKDIPLSSFKSIKGKATATTRKIAPKRVVVDADSKDRVGNQPPPRPKFDSKRMKEMSDTDVFSHAWNTSLLSHAKRGKRSA